MADRAGTTAGESKPLIFPLVAEPGPRRRWTGQALTAAAIVVALVAAAMVAAAQVRSGAMTKLSGVVAGSGDAVAGSAAGTEHATSGDRMDGNVSVFELQPGTCLRTLETGADVRDVPIVGCDVPHEAEVVATVRMPTGRWPGRAAVDAFAAEHCVAEIHAAGIDAAPGLMWSYFAPSADTWTRLADRTVSCLLLSEEGLLTGSLLGEAGAVTIGRALLGVGTGGHR